MLKLAHIINPVNAPEGTELYRVQPVTFESIKNAKLFTSSNVEVSLYAVGYDEDTRVIPDFFHKLNNLQHSVLDHGTFSKKRKLPLLADILQSLYDNTDSEWLIYTNADICLMPQFYDVVASVIAEGHDAILITRRRISRQYTSPNQLPMMYCEIGRPHPGYDCFIFHRSLLQHFILDKICIGIPFIEVTLLHNILAFAKRTRHIDELHLTFHIGMEVMPPIDQEYYRYNRGIYINSILPKLKPLLHIDKFPYSLQPPYKRAIKWMINPCFSSTLMLELQGKKTSRKIKILLDEIRWRVLSK